MERPSSGTVKARRHRPTPHSGAGRKLHSGFGGDADAEILHLVGTWDYDTSDIGRYDLHTRNATAYFETRAAADAAGMISLRPELRAIRSALPGRVLLAQRRPRATEAFGKN
jgi:hypothetical protein